MSTYKATIQGSDHKQKLKDIDKNPIIVGHEFCGELLEVGKWEHKFCAGHKVYYTTFLKLCYTCLHRATPINIWVEMLHI